MIRIPSIFLCLLVVLFLSGSLVAAEPSTTHPPNVVLILVDDLGWADLGCYGSTFHETPNLDALAKRGALFTDAYAASPVCSPTRASILSGKYPSRIGMSFLAVRALLQAHPAKGDRQYSRRGHNARRGLA